MTLAILPNWLGDLVMVEPAVRALRATGPVTGVVAPGLAALVEDAGLVDRIEIFDRRGRDRGLSGIWRAGRRLRGADSAWVFGPSLRAAALAASSAARRRIGFGGAGRELFLNEARRPESPPRSRHLVDAWLSLVDEVVDPDARCTWVAGDRGRKGLTELERAEPRLAGPFVAFAASANYGATKEWPESGFVEVARALREQCGLEPVFIGSSADGERHKAAALSRRTGGVDLAGRTDLPTLAALFARASMFVGNDSGPMHLAAALGTPTVGIFGSTSPDWTAPRGPSARVVGPAPVLCTPCFRRTCPYDRECLAGIDPARVIGAARGLLERGAA